MIRVVSNNHATEVGGGLLVDLTNDGIVNWEDFGWQAGDCLRRIGWLILHGMSNNKVHGSQQGKVVSGE